MAHILIVSESDPTFVIKVEETEDGEAIYGDCKQCGDRISDRGHFEDTIQAIQIHVDRNDCQVMIA